MIQNRVPQGMSVRARPPAPPYVKVIAYGLVEVEMGPTPLASAATVVSGLGLAHLHVVEFVAGPMAEGRTPIARRMREAFDEPVVVNGAFNRDLAASALRGGKADAVAFGTAFLAYPDLPERLRDGAPLRDLRYRW
jgi:2,4-dienoyl-CoA reductase-like NADH-dependent reductase (Old Yellow Enzyme family)